MKILLAKDAGYCFGVRDAVNLAYDTAKDHGEVYMLGTIVHNERVIDDLSKAGAKVVDSIDDVPKNTYSLHFSEIAKKKTVLEPILLAFSLCFTKETIVVSFVKQQGILAKTIFIPKVIFFAISQKWQLYVFLGSS